MNFGNLITADCANIPTPPDPRCENLAFALANPDICPVAPFLVLKPSIGLLCTLGSIQLRAVYTKDGVETDVTDESIFTTSDPDVAVVGATSGNATGVGIGSATFKAVYNDGTNDVEAFSEVSVLGENCCDDQSVAMMVCVENSKSMSLSFGSGYTTRLAFAKAAATRFIDSVNESKDVVGLLKFNDDATTVLAEPTADKDSVSALVPGIPQTQQKTSFYEAITQAITSLDDVTTADRKIIVIISDGEDTTPSYDETNNPIALLDDFKSTGGIVICLGARAHGAGFSLLSRMSTGGFFINGYGATASDVLDYFIGLKGYVCAGNCVPEGDEYVGTGSFNYDDFINWDVEGGYVDLQGEGFFDYLPGNGLYVDLISGMQPSGSSNGRLVLKDAEAISIESGKDYRLTVALSGNQQFDRVDTVRVQVFWKNTDPDETPNYLLNQLITLTDFTQGFSDRSFTFEADADRDVFISVQQENVPTGSFFRAGVLLNSVKFEDITDQTVVFEDDFDSENLTYVPPACGTGTIYTSEGYITGSAGCYGEGCLDEPPPAQLQDPSPLPNIEAGYHPPTTYTSEKTKCASCGAGFMNVSDTPLTLAPLLISSQGPPKSCIYQLATPAVLKRFCIGNYIDYITEFNDLQIYGSNNMVTWNLIFTAPTQVVSVQNAYACFLLTDNTTSYAYYRVQVSSLNPDRLNTESFTLVDANAFYGEAASQESCATETAESEISQQQADTDANAAALAEAKAGLNCMAIYTSTQQYKASCPVGTFGTDVTRSVTKTSLNSLQEAEAWALEIATAEALAARVCTLSNNDQAIQFNNGTVVSATPYPSVQHVTGAPESITKVTVTLVNVRHYAFQTACLVLRAPDGTCVMLLNPDNVSGEMVFSNLEDVTFDDDAATTMPYGNPHPGGTFKPTIIAGGETLQFPGSAPAQPYGVALSDFIGLDGNGSWSLWAIHKQFYSVFNPVNAKIFNGWFITIT